jgi:hypothetical protein
MNKPELVSATSKYIRIAPNKIDVILKKIRGKSYKDALKVLKYLPQKSGAIVWQTLYSAISNAINNFDLENYDAFFGNHYGDVETFTCGTFGASKNNPIFKYFVDTMINQYPERYWYGPSFYADVLKSYFNCEEKDISHDEFAKRYFDNNRILYINFDEFHVKYFWHHALYSWSPIMEKTFKEGNYE